MASFRHLFVKDFRIKALALVMAFAVYVHVFSAQDREMVYSVPVVIAPLSGGLALSNTPAKFAHVRVHASGKNLLKLRTRGFHAEVKIEGPRPGSLQRPLLASDFLFPRGVKVIGIEVIEPAVLDLQIEPAATMEVPVAPRIAGMVSADRALVRRPTPVPRTVRVTGPRTALTALDSILTVPVTIEGVRGDFEQEAELAPPANMTADPTRVRLRIELEERLERHTDLIPVKVSLPPWTQLVAVDPDSGSVWISGAVSGIGQVQLEDIQLVADIHRRSPRVQKVLLRATIPSLSAQVPVRIRCDPESVQVIIR